MGDPVQQPAIIDVQQSTARSVGWSKYRFVLRTHDGQVIERSEEFVSGYRAIMKGRPERKRLKVFLGQLGQKGWTVTYEPTERFGDPWYGYRLAGRWQPSAVVTPAPYPHPYVASAPLTTQPRGTSTTKMWIITLIVIVALFFICVLLVFTTQFEIKPA